MLVQSFGNALRNKMCVYMFIWVRCVYMYMSVYACIMIKR